MKELSEVTQLLLSLDEGDPGALDQLVPLLYDELRKLARARLRQERPDHTLNTTALVHEAYLKLVDIKRVKWKSRAHFLATASRVMRRVLVDYAHKRRAYKRGGRRQKLGLDEALLIPEAFAESVADLDEALGRLEAVSPRQSEIIEQRYFGGLTLEETAAVLGVSLATAKRDLRFAKAWLTRELRCDIELSSPKNPGNGRGSRGSHDS